MFQDLLCGQAIGGRFGICDGQPRKRLFIQVGDGRDKSCGLRAPERQLASGIGETRTGNGHPFGFQQLGALGIGCHEYIKRSTVANLGVEFARGAEAGGDPVTG